MEYEELQALWKTYDQKLDKLEKLNKTLVAETLARKPQKKIQQWMLKNIYGMLVGPIVLSIVLYPYFRIENVNIRFIIGCVLTLAVMINLIYIYYKGYTSLQKIDLLNDPVIQSVKKVNALKTILFGNIKYHYLLSLTLLVGILLIIWDDFHFSAKTISFLVAYVALMIFWMRKKVSIHVSKLEKLKSDISQLEEYL